MAIQSQKWANQNSLWMPILSSNNFSLYCCSVYVGHLVTVLLECFNLQLFIIFSSQCSYKSISFHLYTFFQANRQSSSCSDNQRTKIVPITHMPNAFGYLLCPILCWHNWFRLNNRSAIWAVKLHDEFFFHSIKIALMLFQKFLLQ